MEKQSKYYPLYKHLIGLPQDYISLTFKDIEDVLNNKLPSGAYRNRAWWANNPDGHPQASAWLEAGYKAQHLDLFIPKVAFVKVAKDD